MLLIAAGTLGRQETPHKIGGNAIGPHTSFQQLKASRAVGFFQVLCHARSLSSLEGEYHVFTWFFFLSFTDKCFLWPLPHCVTIGVFVLLDKVVSSHLSPSEPKARGPLKRQQSATLPAPCPRLLWAPTPQVMRRGFLSHASRLDAGGAFGHGRCGAGERQCTRTAARVSSSADERRHTWTAAHKHHRARIAVYANGGTHG